ncbi:MAG: hypothetical protein Q8L86_18350 [Vicinamibacterales bacterium]|nr:hypothetical protein [Vicinamibacterales bacterium]
MILRPVAAAALALTTIAVPVLPAQPAALPEVRQIVTFDLQPGALSRVLGIYLGPLLKIYETLQPLLRFRAYLEAESPESLDLVVVSSYRGMAGLDAANHELFREGRDGPSVGLLYQEIDRHAIGHHDQFIEMIEALSDPWAQESGGEPQQLTVFEYLRVVPGSHAFVEDLIAARVRPFELDERLHLWSETGRVLVGDGWDYVRIFGVASLGAWHDALQRTRTAEFQQALAPVVMARKTIILRREPRLSLR